VPTTDDKDGKEASFFAWIKDKAIIGAVIVGTCSIAASVIGVMLSHHGAAGARSIPRASATSVDNSHRSNTAPSQVSPSSSAPVPTSVIFHGSIAFGNYGIDFNTDTPTNVSGQNTVFIDNSPPTILSTDPQNILISWPNTHKPTQAECRQFAITHPLWNPINVQVGMQFCIYTGEDRTVYLKVTSIDDVAGSIGAEVTVWSN
jgi:hypothetical protein